MASQGIFSVLVGFLILQTCANFVSATEISQAPKIINLVDKLTHPEGTNATLTCSIGSGELESLTFEWLKDDKRIAGNTNTKKLKIATPPDNFQSVLRIFDLRPSDSAVYSCIAKNSYGQDKISTQLNVKVQLKWVAQPQDVEVAVGRQLHIPCAAEGLPAPTIEWTKVEDSKPQILGPELRFVSVSQQDAGHYECRAKNGAEKDLVSRIELNVLAIVIVVQIEK